MSFYVTLPSHANRKEFPNNQANWFKIRLPQPLRLSGESWYVGLSSISIPDTTVNLKTLTIEQQPLVGMSCFRVHSVNDTKLLSLNLPLSSLELDTSIVDGVRFMKAALRWFDKRFTELSRQFYGYLSEENGKHTCPLFKWENQDLFVDNKNVARKNFNH